MITKLARSFRLAAFAALPGTAGAPAQSLTIGVGAPKLTVATIESVYLFNMALDMRDRSPQVSAKDGSALPKNPLQDAGHGHPAR